MIVVTKKISLSTKGNTEIIDITNKVTELLKESKLVNGMVTLFIPGATGALTTIEHEPGLVKDFRSLLTEIVPQDKDYAHNRSHMDGNAHSHLRASLIGPSLSIPFVDSKLTLGTWQQIIFVDLDNRSRNREIVVQIIGMEAR